MTAGQKKTLLVLVAIVLAFAAGSAWQFVRARSLSIELQSSRAQLDSVRTQLDQRLDSTTNALAFQHLEATLAAAALETQRGSYEAGRSLTSAFFTGLQDNIDHAPATAASTLREILTSRDELITNLSRSDTQSQEQLVHLFVRFRTAMGERAESPDREPTPARSDTSGGR